jgi:N-acylneuraminate cytidylyltransferase
MKDERVLGLLTARGGSKRIKGKNTRLFAGKPILLWPLETLLASRLFARVVVSTEDPDIMRLAREGGAEVPFVRPLNLADDNTGTLPVIRHAVETLADQGEEFSSVCCVYGTSAFLTLENLLRARELLADAEAALAATVFEHPIQRAFQVKNGLASFPERKFMNARTQDLPPYYHDLGLFYWLKIAPLTRMGESADLCDFRVRPLILPRGDVMDIDTEEDWLLAEQRFTAGRRMSGS